MTAVWLGLAVGQAKAAPSPPSPPLSQYVVYGEQGVFIGAGSQVTGLVGANTGAANAGGVSIGMNGSATVDGDVRSGGDVRLANADTITGQLILPTTATLISNASDVIGSVLRVDPPVLLPSLPAPTPITCPTNGPDTILGNGATFDAVANTLYGDVQVGGSSTINFPIAGNYYFQSLQAGNGLTINSAKGVHVFVCDTVTFGSGHVLPTTLTSFDLTFEVQSNDLHNAFRATGFQWIGDVLTPNGGIHFGASGAGATFKGTLHGQAVDIEHGVIIHSDKAFKSGTKFDDVNGNGARDPGEPGLPGWVIHLYGTDANGSPFHSTATTDASGNYSFDVPAGTYTVCEQLQAGWAQTFPTSGADCSTGDPAADNPTPGPVGYSIVLADGAQDTGNDFGNHQRERQASFSISGTKHLDNLQGAGLPGWTMRLYDMPADTLDPQSPAVTDANGNYVFGNLAAGTYKVCEVMPDSSWQQVAPNPGTATCNGLDEAAQGHLITVGPSSVGNDFANTRTRCEKQPVQQVLDPTSGRFPGNKGPDVFVILSNGDSIQNAIDSVTDRNNDGYYLIQVLKDSTGQLGGSANQRFTISKSYDKTFGLIGCSNTLVNPDPTMPTELISASAGSPGNIFVMDLHGSGSSVAGVKVEGSGRELRNVYANDNTGVGYLIVGDGNTVHNGQASNNKGDGVSIRSNGNTLTDTDLFGNGGNGVSVAGKNNQLLKLDAGDKGKGNAGDGIHVVGDSNLVSEPGAFANGGDGIDVAGNSNTVAKPVVGDKGKGNGADGIRIAGTGNSVTEGKASANKGNGYELGGGTAGSPNVLSKDVSNTGNSGDASLENTGAEFKFLNSVRNSGGGNKADNIVVPKTSSPAKCATFPNTNVTGTFGAANVCE